MKSEGLKEMQNTKKLQCNIEINQVSNFIKTKQIIL